MLALRPSAVMLSEGRALGAQLVCGDVQQNCRAVESACLTRAGRGHLQQQHLRFPAPLSLARFMAPS